MKTNIFEWNDEKEIESNLFCQEFHKNDDDVCLKEE